VTPLAAKVLASLAAIVAGWVVAFAALAAALTALTGAWPEPLILRAWLIGTAMATLLAWMVCGLPLLLFVPATSRPPVWPRSALAGAALGVAACIALWAAGVLLLAWTTRPSLSALLPLLLFAVLLGVTAVSLYGPIVRRLV
jgi:hypothetical protein